MGDEFRTLSFLCLLAACLILATAAPRPGNVRPGFVRMAPAHAAYEADHASLAMARFLFGDAVVEDD